MSDFGMQMIIWGAVCAFAFVVGFFIGRAPKPLPQIEHPRSEIPLSLIGNNKMGRFFNTGISSKGYIGDRDQVIESILHEHVEKEDEELVIIEGDPIASIHTDQNGERWVTRHDHGTVVNVK